MVKKIKPLLLIFLSIDGLFVFWMLLSEKDKYLYPKFTFNFYSFLINAFALLILNLVIVLIVMFVRKSTKTRIVLLTLASLFGIWLIGVFSAFTVAGAFWQSETDNYEEFAKVDEYLDLNLEVAGLRLSDIIELEIEEVENFYYSYRSVMAADVFAFVGDFYFRENSYNELKMVFKDACEFEETILAENEQLELGVTGYYVFNSTIPTHEISTSIDYFKSLKISFCDEKMAFYIDLSGECYT
ncbi:MAG: hypothetical protein J6Q85_00215 [Clostridia bacterium]|nr:hypothetical protein [Clostridia bacterium]